METFLNPSAGNSDQQLIFTAVENLFRNMFSKQREIRICEFTLRNPLKPSGHYMYLLL
jgi:hypothetical protein